MESTGCMGDLFADIYTTLFRSGNRLATAEKWIDGVNSLTSKKEIGFKS